MTNWMTAALFATAAMASGDPHLNLTALTKRHGLSVLECWQLSSPIITASSQGLTGASALSLGALDSATWVVQPPRSVGGLRNAPQPTFTWVVSGLLHITLVNGTDEAYVPGGRYGLIFADDDNTPGHVSHFSGPDETVLMLLQPSNGTVPGHTVLHRGPCEWNELVGV